MKPAKFDYERPADLQGAIALLQGADGDGKLLAGGQTLVPMMNLRLAQPGLLVDIRRLEEIRRIEDEGDHLFLGAGITHAAIEDGAVPDPSNGMMPYVARAIAYRAVRNRGTVGGSVAHADPSGDWPTALLALGAEAHVVGPAGERSVALEEMFLGAFTTVLEPDEIIDGFRIPKLSRGARWAYYKVCRKPGEFADSIGAVVIDGDRSFASVVLGATDGAPIRFPALAERLAAEGGGDFSGDDARAALTEAGAEFDDFETQIHATALSRAVKRAFAQ